MQKVTLVNGNHYIGLGYSFNKGDFADVSKEDAKYLLSVKDAKGRNRFKAGAVIKDEDTSGRGDMKTDDLAPATNQGIKDRLDEMGVEYPTNANKEQLTELFANAIAERADEDSEEDEDSESDEDGNDESGNVTV